MVHTEKHFKGSVFIRDMVIGMSDGLTVPFALAAGLAGAVDSSHTIVTAGIAEVVAGSIAMGLGGYLAGKTDVEHYKAELGREYYEVDHFPQKEKDEVEEVFLEYGLSETLRKQVVEEISRDKDKWVEFMMRFELGLEKPDPQQARKSALTIGLSYVVGGIIPLFPYFLMPDAVQALGLSSVITLISLFVFGWYKSHITGQKKLKGALRTTAIGALAALAAFFCAKGISELFLFHG